MKNYVYNFNWLFTEKVLRIFGSLLVGIWVARYLGPHDFGVLSYAFAFISFFSWASHLGLNHIVVRELTKHPDKSDYIMGSAFLMKLVGALVSVILIVVIIAAVKPEDALIRSVVLILSFIYVFQAFDVIDFYYQAKVISKYAVIARNIAFISSSALKIYLIIAEYDVVYFAFANAVDLALTAGLLVYLFAKTGCSIWLWKFDGSMVKELIKYSWPLMISIFLISIHMKVDQIMIDSMLNVEAVGVYSVAVRLSESWYFIPAIIVSTLMPYFVSLRENNAVLYRVRLHQLLSFMFWLGASVGVATIIAGQQTIVLLFGIEYAEAYWALILCIWGGIFVAQGVTTSLWLISENLQIYRLYIQIIAVCVNIASNLILIPLMGITGAAISTFTTYFLATWVFGLLFKQLRPITLMMLKSISPHYMLAFVREKIRG